MSWKEASIAWTSWTVHVTSGHRLWIDPLAAGRRPEAEGPKRIVMEAA